MRIVDVRAVQPPLGPSPDWRASLGQILVEIETDDGLTGVGVGGGGMAGVHIVTTVLRDFLLGKDAEPVEEHHAALIRHVRFYGRQGLIIMALSGVDLALWDLRAKRRDVSVARLLSPRGEVATRLPMYRRVRDAAAAERAIREGYAGVKLHLGEEMLPDLTELAATVGEVRSAIGPETPLIVDAYAAWTLDYAVKAAEAIHPHQIYWIEEPFGPDRLDDYAQLVKHCPCPVAGGEHESLGTHFEKIIAERLHHVLQPDVTWCGGLTTLMAIYRQADEAYLRVVPHRGAEPFAAQAVAALDPDPLVEGPRPWFTPFADAPAPERGGLDLPDRAGFGVTMPTFDSVSAT